MKVSGNQVIGTEKTSFGDFSELITIQKNGSSRPIAASTSTV